MIDTIMHWKLWYTDDKGDRHECVFEHKSELDEFIRKLNCSYKYTSFIPKNKKVMK